MGQKMSKSSKAKGGGSAAVFRAHHVLRGGEGIKGSGEERIMQLRLSDEVCPPWLHPCLHTADAASWLRTIATTLNFPTRVKHDLPPHHPPPLSLWSSRRPL